jgi:hypothetical protein
MALDPRGWESTSATWLRSACTVLAAALALQLPAELISPLVRVGPLGVTNVEATGYLLLLAWLAAIATRALPRPRLHGWVLVAIGIFLAGAAIAAGLALYDRATAGKVLARMVVALAIGLAAASLVSSGGRRWQIVAAAGLAGALFSAVTGLIEFTTGWTVLGRFFALFRVAPISIGGFGTRATGTLLHPNLAGWYWGVCAIAAIGGALYQRGLVRIGLVGAGLVLYVALVLTLSRGALLGILAAGIVLAILLVRGHGRRFLPAATLIVAPLPVIVVLLSVFSPLIAARLRTETDIEWYHFAVAAPPSMVSTAATLTIPVTVTNDGPIVWPSSGTGSVLVSYHVRKTNGTYYDYDGISTELPRSLPPHGSVTVDAHVLVTGRLTEAVIEWDLRQRGATWFSLRLPATLSTTRVQVQHALTEPTKPVEPPPNAAAQQLLRSQSFGRGDLWRIAVEMIKARPIFGIGLDNFRLGYGDWRGLSTWDTTINTNNMYLELLVSVGLFALPLAAVGAAALLRLLRTVRRSNGPEALWLVTLVALLVHGLLDSFVLFSTALYLGAFAMAGGSLRQRITNHRADS